MNESYDKIITQLSKRLCPGEGKGTSPLGDAQGKELVPWEMLISFIITHVIFILHTGLQRKFQLTHVYYTSNQSIRSPNQTDIRW